MENWKQTIIATQRGNFEVFQKGEGPPLCVTHHYSVFNESGDYYAEAFTKTMLSTWSICGKPDSRKNLLSLIN